MTNCVCGHSKSAHCSYDGKPPFVCLGYWFAYIDDKDCKCELWRKPFIENKNESISNYV